MKIIFVHIPRTGGSTFCRLLENWYPSYHRETGYKDKIEIREDRKCISGHFSYQPKFKNHFVCTFVRNPIDLVMSLWLYHNKESDNKMETPLDKNPSNFGPLMKLKRKSLQYDTWLGNNIQNRYFNGATIADFDFVGLTEKFNESIEVFKAVAPPSESREWDKSLRENTTNKEGIKIRPEWIERIKELNKEDFKLYEKVKKLYEV